MARIAVIGLGNMGAPMAANLAQDGHAVTGYDPAWNDPAQPVGKVQQATSAVAAVSDAEVVLTMLPDGETVADVLTGSAGVFAHLPRGGLVIDSSTIDVESSRRMHAAAGQAGHAFADAPVSGGMTGAEAGTLTFMVGAETATVDRCRGILLAMGARVVHAGGPGAGSAAKIVNNMLLGISLAGVCEAFVLAERLGLDPGTFFDIATTSSGDCWALRTWTPVAGIVAGAPSSNDWTPGFSTALMLKDLQLANAAAQIDSAPLEMASTAGRLFSSHADSGYSDRDCSSLIESIGGRR
ncbi:MAG TPA: 3-hydroxyisobutyrate dehydrogenase [Candidatus Avipropionibacterium avicola]|uniref:3-hydroxyisobutyrate dehydrogenase n=1 Tax=Candidatus Avipropionibacterium avicola TaxID=2840701 RepID=A0A9D1H0F6_9ACTN|nr:3-hydroxyisobutyrate dehydrogenase [Candidatus Avipropionibacterium avicola]